MAQPNEDEGIDDDQLLRDFDDWVQRLPSGWGQIRRLFQSAKSSGVDGSGGLTRSEFIKQLTKKGYRNEEYLNEIFDQILEEEGTKQKQHVADLTDIPYEPEIYYPQVVRFQKRIQYLKCSLCANEDQSPTAEFVKMLMKKCGSTLRAWRLHLDLRSTGRIAYNDFTVACRKLGVAAQAKHVWNNAKEEGGLALELHELDPKEGQNLEKFAEVLWYSFGLDLQKAWQYFDVHSMKFVALEVFGKAARGIGFEGNVKMLFKGLDAAGLGKVKESDFLYIAKVSRLASKKLGLNGKISQAMSDLLTWTQRELGGPHELIAKLELGSDGQLGVPVAELAARISALGFDGDSMDVATEAARTEDGTFVSAECLYTLLTTGRPTRPTLPVSPPPSPIRPSTLAAFAPNSSPSSPRRKKVRQAAWQSNVDNFSDVKKFGASTPEATSALQTGPPELEGRQDGPTPHQPPPARSASLPTPWWASDKRPPCGMADLPGTAAPLAQKRRTKRTLNIVGNTSATPSTDLFVTSSARMWSAASVAQ
eukprot:CAMPEP_0206465248 /NCGR_PEP_ID=MMETSP0324_2-20121206/27712_1 /ASSEMBLY_ACC=CAM_ASM_000836 /TAXON_ID=2866 /ORGANISM="Crypthecodinium cohnii, Strain Seligo" /LENGTH=534 /DNA_ID=CAMNT_0053938061 /DNA_START=119 /DNA_END=1724 /DNA_ORIENTATION=+